MTSWFGTRVCTSTREPGRRPPTSRAARGEQGERLLGGSVAGRQQLLVEVEERDCVGLDDPVQRRLGADMHAGRAQLVAVGRHVDHRLACQRLELLADAGHTGPEVA